MTRKKLFSYMSKRNQNIPNIHSIDVLEASYFSDIHFNIIYVQNHTKTYTGFSMIFVVSIIALIVFVYLSSIYIVTDIFSVECMPALEHYFHVDMG